MAIEDQPEEYSAVSINRSLKSLQRDLKKVAGINQSLSAQTTVNVSVTSTTVTFTVTFGDGTIKTGTVTIA